MEAVVRCISGQGTVILALRCGKYQSPVPSRQSAVLSHHSLDTTVTDWRLVASGPAIVTFIAHAGLPVARHDVTSTVAGTSNSSNSRANAAA